MWYGKRMYLSGAFSVVILLVLAVACGASDVAILVDHTPTEGGDTSPGGGVHRVVVGSTIVITATPKPGFVFSYWLGDVADPMALTTYVLVDKPKIVIAVFSPAPIEIGSMAGGVAFGEVHWLGRGGPVPSRYEFVDSPSVRGAAVPDEGDEGDYIPEPATLVLLAAGSLAVLRRRR